MPMPFTPTEASPIDPTILDTWLRLDGVDAAEVLELSADALKYAEEYCEATFIQRDRSAVVHDRATEYALPNGPVNSIVSIVDGNDQAVSAYELKRRANRDYVMISQAYELPLTFTYNAGPAALPNTIRRGMLFHVEAMYRDRDGGSDMSGIHRIYDPHRRSQWVG
jgi:hypothetical protein